MKEKLRARRSFITGFGSVLAFAGIGVGRAAAQTAASHFQAARHTDDDWMDKLPGKHRMVIDAVTANGGGEALLFANNLLNANKSAYSLAEQDMAIIVVMRHWATPFAFTDTVWAKYGKPVSAAIKFSDPKTQAAPSTNLYNSPAYGLTLPNLGATIDTLVKRGVQFAICDVATHFVANQLAAGGLGEADAIYKEWVANTIPNSRLVPAGVVAVNRAQERGYTLIYAG